MNAKLLTALFFLSITILTESRSQSFSCDSFCVENIVFDTSFGGQMIVSIHFAGDDEDFINYPHVAAVTDLNGDTLGTSTIDLFGQIGNSTADYHVQTDLKEIPEGFNAIIHFRYDDTLCILSYPCMTTGLNRIENFPFIIYPNPVASKALVALPDIFPSVSARLYNLQGILVKEKNFVQSNSLEIEVDQLVDGVYVLVLQNGTRFSTARILVSNLN